MPGVFETIGGFAEENCLNKYFQSSLYYNISMISRLREQKDFRVNGRNRSSGYHIYGWWVILGYVG